MKKEKTIITIGILLFVAFGLGAIAVSISAVPEISRKINLDITQQRHIFSYDTEIYLEDKKLENCEKDKETRVCKFSCAPDGLCIFVPNKIVKDFSF